MKKLKFQVGDWVRVKAFLRFGYNHKQKRTATPHDLKEPAIAQVTGAAFVPMGSRSLGYPITFTPEGTVFIYLVRTGVTNAEKRVREEDLEICEPLPDGLPMRFATFPPWNEAARAEARTEAKQMSRNAKGRFVSYSSG